MSGIEQNSKLYFGAVSIVIALPTSIKLYNYVFATHSQTIQLPEEQFIVLFLSTFVMGGISGLVLSNFALDIQVHDTYFVVAHFHYVLALGFLTGNLSAILHFSSRCFALEYNGIYVRSVIFILLAGSKTASR